MGVTRITEDERGMQWETVEVSLLVIPVDGDRIPVEDSGDQRIDVAAIAEEAIQAAFRKVHELISEYSGLTYSGDMMPGECFDLDAVGSLFVRSALVNGPITPRH
jgi:hypothetical protein